MGGDSRFHPDAVFSRVARAHTGTTRGDSEEQAGHSRRVCTSPIAEQFATGCPLASGDPARLLFRDGPSASSFAGQGCVCGGSHGWHAPRLHDRDGHGAGAYHQDGSGAGAGIHSEPSHGRSYQQCGCAPVVGPKPNCRTENRFFRFGASRADGSAVSGCANLSSEGQ